MKLLTIWFIGCALLLTQVLAATPTPVNIFNVRDSGAVGDGVVLDTAAINRAVEAASAAGGGIVQFPAGTYFEFFDPTKK